MRSLIRELPTIQPGAERYVASSSGKENADTQIAKDHRGQMFAPEVIARI